MSDNYSLEPFFNDFVSEEEGLTRVLRVTHPRSILEGYYISDEEVGATSYYGYLRKDGYWYIMKAVRTAAVVNYTYVAGSSGYNWAGRAGLSYVSFDNAF